MRDLMENKNLSAAEGCLAFIDKSVTAFHAVENVEERLKEKGFIELKENSSWDILPQKGYYVKRNDSSLIAFRLPEGEAKGFHIGASHSDSPCFKLKAEEETYAQGGYVKLNVEPYGGMLYATWFDRSLSVAGRVICRDKGRLMSKTVNIDEDLLVIPNVAIHLNREMNKELTYNPQIDLQPVLSLRPEEEEQEEGCGEVNILSETGSGREKKKSDQSRILMKKAAACAGVKESDILGKDLFLYVRDKGKLAGAEGELMLSPRLDDLECVYGSMEGFLSGEPVEYISVCAVFDNEEVGSHTKQGAASTFLKDTLEGIGEALGKTGRGYRRMLAESFMVSADNAHGIHPNHPEKSDPAGKPCLNRGIVIKFHGGQKYTTDGYSEAVMRDICEKAQVPCQSYTNRSDIAGGSTLGNISAGQVSIPTVDIGLAQLAMHSAVETAGSLDVEYLIRAFEVFYAQ